MNRGGLRTKPTPNGVPVTMMSPGSSVITSEISLTRVATSKIRSSMLPSCMVSPLSRERMYRPAAPGGSSSAVTISGPKEPERSKFLPMAHWLDLNWKSRTEPSLQIE